MPEISDKTKQGRKFIIVLLVIPVIVIFMEIFLNIISSDSCLEQSFINPDYAFDNQEIFQDDEKIFWRLKPSQTITSCTFNGEDYRINSFGLRGPEIPEKSNNIRIMAIGGSSAFGWGITEDEIFLNRLKALVNSDSTLREIETINGAVPGYSSFQGRRFFASDLLELKPDIIIILFAWADQWPAFNNMSDKKLAFSPQAVPGKSGFLNQSKIHSLIRKMFFTEKNKSTFEVLNRKNPIVRADLNDFYNNLNVIISLAKREKITPLLLTSPIPSIEKYYSIKGKSDIHRNNKYYNLQIKTLAKNSKAGLINIAGEFENYNDLYNDPVNDPIHFNPKGHRAIAEAIYKYLKEKPDLLSVR